MGPRRSSLQKRGSSVTEDVLASETLVRGSLIEGGMMVASEGEGKLVGGELQEKEIAEPPFDANLVRGSLQRGSLRKGSGVREILLDGELAGSEVRHTWNSFARVLYNENIYVVVDLYKMRLFHFLRAKN